MDKIFHVSVSIEGLTEEHKPMTILHNRNSKNRTRHVKCDHQDCEEFIVLHLGYLEYTHYIITVRFFGLETFHVKYTIKNLIFYVRNAPLKI